MTVLEFNGKQHRRGRPVSGAASAAAGGRPAVNPAAEIFESHRPRLLGVACRMLGSRSDAEDLVQDAYLRWHHSPKEEIRSPVAWLVTTTTRLCLDRLRDLKQKRLENTGAWLLATAFEEAVDSPEARRELGDEVAGAFLVVLERLGREERVAFLLHDVFDYDYPEMARMLGKTEPACRQIIRRARVRLREPAPRFSVPPESRDRMLNRFLAALASGARRDVVALLADVEDATDPSERWSICHHLFSTRRLKAQAARSEVIGRQTRTLAASATA